MRKIAMDSHALISALPLACPIRVSFHLQTEWRSDIHIGSGEAS
ncbi:hypothetical protein [Mesorhizobium sp.]|nr:hypothetical protein [Mesorhizobium sp.]